MKLIDTLAKQSNLIRNTKQVYQAGDQKIEVRPLTVGQIIAISPHIAQVLIEDEVNTPEDFHDKVVPQIEKYTEPIRNIFSELFECDFDKLLPIDVMNLLLIVVDQMGTKDFLTSITLVEKVSRNTREEIIAAAQNYSMQSTS